MDDPRELVPYGYAPGNYMNTCHDCGKTNDFCDKRAAVCRPCAEKRLDAALAAAPTPQAEPDEAERWARRDEERQWRERYEIMSLQLRQADDRYMALLKQVADGVSLLQPPPMILMAAPTPPEQAVAIRQAVLAERERCAKMCDDLWDQGAFSLKDAAAEIRSGT